MDAMQVGLPILGIVAAAAAITFYAVSFSEIREVYYIPFSLSSLLIYYFFIFSSTDFLSVLVQSEEII